MRIARVLYDDEDWATELRVKRQAATITLTAYSKLLLVDICF